MAEQGGSTNYESRRSNSARVSRCIEIGAGLPLQEQDLPSNKFQFTRLRYEVNPRITYFYVSRFFHLERQDSLSLTPPSAWRKRQVSPQGELLPQCNRSGHVFSFACDGLPISFFLWQPHPKNA